MEPMWSKETGWSQKPWPYVLYCGVFGAVMGFAGLFPRPDGMIGYTVITAVAVTVFSSLLGFVFWLVARAYRSLNARYRSPFNKMSEQ